MSASSQIASNYGRILRNPGDDSQGKPLSKFRVFKKMRIRVNRPLRDGAAPSAAPEDSHSQPHHEGTPVNTVSDEAGPQRSPIRVEFSEIPATIYKGVH